jgi:hypothetical protein
VSIMFLSKPEFRSRYERSAYSRKVGDGRTPGEEELNYVQLKTWRFSIASSGLL